MRLYDTYEVSRSNEHFQAEFTFAFNDYGEGEYYDVKTFDLDGNPITIDASSPHHATFEKWAEEALDEALEEWGLDNPDLDYAMSDYAQHSTHWGPL